VLGPASSFCPEGIATKTPRRRNIPFGLPVVDEYDVIHKTFKMKLEVTADEVRTLRRAQSGRGLFVTGLPASPTP